MSQEKNVLFSVRAWLGSARVTIGLVMALSFSQAMGIPASALEGPVAQLEDLLGTWEVEGQWVGGPKLWARAQYWPGIGGRSIEARVLVQDADQPPYQRYHTVLTHDAKRDAWVAHSFKPDGSHSASDFKVEGKALITEWSEGGMRIRDRTELLDDRRMKWLVQMAREGTDEFQTVMDTVWHKSVPQHRVQPVNTTLFHSGADSDSFVVEETIQAPVDVVYRAWTHGPTFASTYDPNNDKLAANIDLAIGGRFEWLWDGVMGSNDCQVLSFIPDRMLSFSWNAPPDQARSRAQRTWVVVELAAAGDEGTHVRLTHLGFGAEPHWQQTREYFAKAWPHVLAQFRKHLESARQAKN